MMTQHLQEPSATRRRRGPAPLPAGGRRATPRGPAPGGAAAAAAAAGGGGGGANAQRAATGAGAQHVGTREPWLYGGSWIGS